MNTRVSQEEYETIRVRYLAGDDTADIAKDLGYSSRSVVARRVSALRAKGLLPSTEGTALSVIANLRDGRAPIGTMRDLLAGLPASIGRKLIAETPNGANVADLIRAIIVDAYATDGQ